MLALERHTTSSGAKSRAGDVNENRAAAARDPRTAVVIELDNQVVEVIGAPEAIARLVRAAPDCTIVPTIGGVLDPRIVAPNGAHWQQCARTGQPVRAPPEPYQPERAAGCRAIAFPLVGRNPGAAERHRNSLQTDGHPAPRPRSRAARHANHGDLPYHAALSWTHLAPIAFITNLLFCPRMVYCPLKRQRQHAQYPNDPDC